MLILKTKFFYHFLFQTTFRLSFLTFPFAISRELSCLSQMNSLLHNDMSNPSKEKVSACADEVIRLTAAEAFTAEEWMLKRLI